VGKHIEYFLFLIGSTVLYASTMPHFASLLHIVL